MGTKRKNVIQDGHLFPNLSGSKWISIDIESKDPDLKKKGPGPRRGDGYILGVSLCTDSGFNEYLAFKHPEKNNCDQEKALRYLKEQLSTDIPKIGANVLYDFDWLMSPPYNLKIEGPWFDVQIAEPLLNEERKVYNLNSLAEEYLGMKKEEAGIEEYARARGWKDEPQAHLWRMPGDLVGKYARVDTELPPKIFDLQIKKLKDQDLWDLFLMESELLKVVLDMRQRGIRMDIKKAEVLKKKYSKELKAHVTKLKMEDIWNARDFALLCDKEKISYSHTRTGEPSFTKMWLENHQHPLCRTLARARKLDKFVGTFLDNIINLSIKGRLHPLFHPLRNDDWGTVSGRFSASLPNPQFMPNKKADPEMGPEVRSLFLPETGESWGRVDYSQIEVRGLAHYAVGPGAEEIRQRYRENPKTDYHDLCMEITGLERKPSKGITFGVIYGMGVGKLIAQLGLNLEDGKAMLNQYMKAMPFIKQTQKAVKETAERRGYIFTILKRRRRFNTWEPCDFDLSRTKEILSTNREEVIRAVNERIVEASKNGSKPPRPGARRAFCYKALNALIQGSAADLMKKAMYDSYKAGLFKKLGVLITVHDELGVSYHDKKSFLELIDIMENAIKFKVPTIVEAESGKNWGYLEGIKR
jgi:DNA polymerase I-like protein with 3'-5' exonuclease and polymerase domains